VFDMHLHLYAFNLDFCERLCADIDDAVLWTPAAPGVHAPGWILGHLAISTDFAAGCAGLERACPASWHRAFGPVGPRGSGVELEPRASKAELLEALRAGHARVDPAVRGVDAASLAGPHGAAALRGTSLTTVRDALSHLLTTHEALHLGQLTMCRRLIGLPALM
jgi:hypothetical protein